MESTFDQSPKDPSRRAFLSASTAAAVTVPILARVTSAGAAHGRTASPLTGIAPDPALVMMLSQVDPGRIQATIQRLVQFGTRHTASSLTDPVRGIGAATAWVTAQMQAIAATSSGNMTVRQQTFNQPPAPRLPNGATITN